MINSKNLAYFFIPYLTISCGIYHIVYWGAFGLNGLSMISTEDIIKTSITSITVTFFGSILGYFFAIKLIKSKFKNETNYKSFISSFILLVFYLIIYYLSTLIPGPYNFETLAFFISLIIVDWINIDFVFEKSFNPKINKELCLLMLLYFPLNSIGSAISDSLNIQDNLKFIYSLKVNKDSNTVDTLKLIGKNENNFIFSDIKNQKIYIIQNDTIILAKKRY